MALLCQLPHSSVCSSSFGGRRSDRSSSIRGGGSLVRLPKCSPRARKAIARKNLVRISAMSNETPYKMNLNEYMVTLERPLGIRFALSTDGRIFVHSLMKGGNAEKSRIVMVGDALKKANGAPDGGFTEIKDFKDAEMMLKNNKGSFSLVLERPFSPYPIQHLHPSAVYHTLFNKGQVAFATWNKNVLAKDLYSDSEANGKSGFAIFSAKFLQSEGWMLLSSQGSVNSLLQSHSHPLAKHAHELISTLSEEEQGEWAYGSFPLEEYIKALDRAKGELYYNHSLGMQFSRITDSIYVGSCIQTETDVQALAKIGITAVLNFQSDIERANWGINSASINDFCRQNNILMVNYPIREVDSLDLRKKLPFCVGLLLRLLRKNFRIFVTCTTGFDRSPACVIAYLHWIQDTALHAAHNFVTGLHPCRPDRAAIVWATWDLIAMVENGNQGGPPTHAVNFVWSNGCGEGDEVCLVGDFTNNWKDNIKAVYKGGSKFEVEHRLRHGKYHYKFIVNGQWRHSTALPVESDERGNVNNVIRVGDVARIRPAPSHLQIKDRTSVKVIERPLTEDERFMLAFAARRIAFSICPIRLAPK
ncbi:phosphoglucan phosphatase LSF1, chloroplastic [Curcuma longa]|uniref:phosphoglucan phosphatase LSF1, chloroplastic n=1 Tax=Curcuma longa TaxID=136217 RepID=UPI003D9F2614